MMDNMDDWQVLVLAAQNGDADAQLRVAKGCQAGEGREQNHEEVLKWALEAAE